MTALFGNWRNSIRGTLPAVEFALDFAPEAITLYERAITGGWRKFASAPLDDPEFQIVIGLLRTEAEARAAGRRPVRLWLPGDQILKRTARIEETDEEVRLRAAFRHIARRTVYRPEDVAVAVGPANRQGETTILVTFTETWREAREYAVRWGFVPGDVSTRHFAGDFGPDGPVFRIKAGTGHDRPRAGRNRVALAAGAAMAAAGALLLIALQPWQTTPGPSPPPPVPETPIAAAPEPAGAPETTAAAPPAPVDAPETWAGNTPPAQRDDLAEKAASLTGAPGPAEPYYSADAPVLAAIDAAKQAPVQLAVRDGGAGRPDPVVPVALTAPAAVAAVPVIFPPVEPPPLERDPVAAWAGPVPELSAPAAAAPSPALDAGVTGPAIPAHGGVIALLAAAGEPSPHPVIHAPEPAPAATAAPPAPDGGVTGPALAEQGEVVPRVATAGELSPHPGIRVPELAAAGAPPGLAAPAAPAAPANAAPAPAADVAAAPFPMPPPRPAPAQETPSTAGEQSGEPSPLALLLPPPRPPRDVEAPSADPGQAPPQIGAALSPPDAAPSAVAPAAGIAAPAEEADPNAPARNASLTSPIPRVRPALAALAPAPSVGALPALAGAATEQDGALDRAALIGIAHVDGGRRALLRLPDGRYRSVVVGDTLAGWRVSMIGVDAMQVTRGGEKRTLPLISR